MSIFLSLQLRCHKGMFVASNTMPSSRIMIDLPDSASLLEWDSPFNPGGIKAIHSQPTVTMSTAFGVYTTGKPEFCLRPHLVRSLLGTRMILCTSEYMIEWKLPKVQLAGSVSVTDQIRAWFDVSINCILVIATDCWFSVQPAVAALTSRTRSFRHEAKPNHELFRIASLASKTAWEAVSGNE